MAWALPQAAALARVSVAAPPRHAAPAGPTIAESHPRRAGVRSWPMAARRRAAALPRRQARQGAAVWGRAPARWRAVVRVPDSVWAAAPRARWVAGCRRQGWDVHQTARRRARR